MLANPSDQRLAVLLSNGQIVMIDLEAGKVTTTFGSDFTAACWSVKGKQLACGTRDGRIVQYTPEGEERASIPSAKEGGVIDVRWLENDLFYVVYAASISSDGLPLETPTSIVQRTKTSLDYALCQDDPTAPMGQYEMRSPRRFVVSLKNWHPFKHLVTALSNAGSQFAVLSSSDSKWSVGDLDEAARPSLPLSESTASDTCPLGLDIDLTVAQQSGDLGPAPILTSFSSDGLLTCWSIQNSATPVFPGLSAPLPLSSRSSAPHTAQPQEAFTYKPTTFGQAGFGTFGQAGFGNTAKSTGLAPTSSSSAFSAFAQKSSTFSTPSFGSAAGESLFGAVSKPSSGFSAFSNSAAGESTPKFSFNGAADRLNDISAGDRASGSVKTTKVPGLDEDETDQLEPASVKPSDSAGFSFGGLSFNSSALASSTPVSSVSFGGTPAFGNTTSAFGTKPSTPSTSSPFTSTASPFTSTSSPFTTASSTLR